MKEFAIKPDPEDARLVRRVSGVDQEGKPVETSVVMERPLTLFLNGQEIVTMMTIGDHPDYLAIGYLLNQNMLRPDDRITAVEYDEELETVIVRTVRRTNFEKKLRKKTLTSGCAQGTVFGDLMEKFAEIRLPGDAVLKTSWLYALTKKINTAPSLYLAAGAIHGCVLCEEDRPLVYMEDRRRGPPRRRPVAPHGWRRQMPAPVGRPRHSGARHRPRGASSRRARRQRQRRSGAVRDVRPAGRRRQRSGFRGPAGRHPRRPR